MAQASQALPSWLTLSSTLITEPDGSVSTSYATLRLPLTYYGPSIPLGTDGSWTWGGLTPPPSTSPTPEPTATPSPSESTAPPPSTITPSESTSLSSIMTMTSSQVTTSPTITPAPSSSESTFPSSTSAASSTTGGPVAGTQGRGISTAVLGAILGSILGAMLLLIIILIFCLIRRTSRRRSNPDPQQSSSFWNRQTTVFSRPTSIRTTPIWTGWEIVEPEDEEATAGMRTDGGHDGTRTPGEGSPRGSGEEIDPFLTRRSVRTTKDTEKTHARTETEISHTKTETDTLVSVPAAAALGGTAIRSTPPMGGHILPRDQLMRLAEDDDGTYANIRIVEPSPPQSEHSPLLPPPPLDPDGLMGLGVRVPSSRRQSIGSQNAQVRSIRSEKSVASLDTDPAELLVARRVRVADLNEGQSRLPTIPSEGEPSSTTHSTLGLTGLTGRIGRLSWFKRMSGNGSGSRSQAESSSAPTDPYTSTPPRSRRGSRLLGSRPGSWSRLRDQGEIEPFTLGMPQQSSDSGLGFGLMPTGERPMSGVSAKSATTNSGNTIYHDARSRPQTPATPVEFPQPVVDPNQQRRLSQMVPDNRVTLSAAFVGIPPNPPPAYDDTSLPRTRHAGLPSNIDVLDLPAPASFSNRNPAFPPGLLPLPILKTWRDSYDTDSPTAGSNSSSAGIAIDVLEDEPPAAREGWRDLTGERDGSRRRTFGSPIVIHPGAVFNSEEGSLHSSGSHDHLRPREGRSLRTQSSLPSSNHTQTGSASSRPSANSRLRSVSSAHSLAHSRSYSSERLRGHEMGELISPPLSAVAGGSFGSTGLPRTRPSSPLVQPPAPAIPEEAYVTPHSSRQPLLSGTMTSSSTGRTHNTNTNSSVTTALTDPITGVIMHFPSLPFLDDPEPRRQLDPWDEDPHHGDDW